MLGVSVSVVSGVVEASRCTGCVFHDLFWYSDALQLIYFPTKPVAGAKCVICESEPTR